MATTPVTVQVTTIGADCGPFTIADNVAGTITTGVSRTTLLSGIVVNADETATNITVTSTGVCEGASLNVDINSIFCPPSPAPDYSYWAAHYYPCDGFCESPGDVVVAFDYGYTPNYTKWYRGPEFIYKIYDTATAPYDIYLSDQTEYASCLAACSITPPPPTYEWYALQNCADFTGIYSQNFPAGTFSIGQRVTDTSATDIYTILSTTSTNPGGVQILIVGTGYTGCPTTPPPSNCREGITLNVTDTGYIKYYNCTTATTDYYYIGSTGSTILPGCIDYTTIIPGFPLIDIAAFTITDNGTTCSTPVTYYYYSGILCGGGITEYFRSTDNNLQDHAAVVKVYSPTAGGTIQCFDNITPSLTSNTNDVISTHTDCTSCAGTPSSVQWLVRNEDCGYGVIYDVGINGDYMNTLEGPSDFPLTSTLYGFKTDPGGINYNSTDNAITAHVTTNLPGSGNCGIMYLYFNGETTPRYEQTFRTSPFVTISGVYIQTGDQVEVRINCYEGPCP